MRETLRGLSLAELESLQTELSGSLRSLRRSAATASFPDFLMDVLEITKDKNHTPLPRHVLEWCDLLFQHDKLHVQASRDHFKTSVFSVGYPLFRVQQVKDRKAAFGIALFSYSEAQAQFNLKRIREYIETTPELKWLLPVERSSVWDVSTLDLSNGCWIAAFGFGSSFRGRHPRIIVIDDACKDGGAMSIPQQVQFFAGTIVPALKTGGQLVVTGNPIGKIDFLEWLEKNPKFPARKYPALNDLGEPLAPDWYSLKDLMDKRDTMPFHNWACEYLLKRVSSADSRFKPEWIKYYERLDILGLPIYKIATIDPSLTPGGDATACMITGTDADSNTYLLDRMGHRGNLHDGIVRICEMLEEHQPDFVGFEEFAFQAMYKVQLQEEMEKRGLNFAIQPLGRDSKKKKAARIESLQPKIKLGKFYFLREHQPTIDQLLLWDPISKHNDDDEIDALGYQVPLWTPGERLEAPRVVRDGETFDEAYEHLALKAQSGWMNTLFKEYRGG